MSNFLSNIEDYLEQISDGSPVSAEGFDDLINKIVVHTGKSYEVCEVLVKYYFQELRNGILRGEIVYLNGIGNIYIKCRKNGTTNANTTIPTIKLFKHLNKKIKYDGPRTRRNKKSSQ